MWRSVCCGFKMCIDRVCRQRSCFPLFPFSPSSLHSFLLLPYPSASLLLSSCFPPLSLLSPLPLLSSSPCPLVLSLPLHLPINAQESVLTTWCSTRTLTQSTLTYNRTSHIVKDFRYHCGCARSALLPLHFLPFSVSLTSFPGFTFITVSLQSAHTYTVLCVRVSMCMCVCGYFPPTLCTIFLCFFLPLPPAPASLLLSLNEWMHN